LRTTSADLLAQSPVSVLRQQTPETASRLGAAKLHSLEANRFVASSLSRPAERNRE
jgi:hypothetical protein